MPGQLRSAEDFEPKDILEIEGFKAFCEVSLKGLLDLVMSWGICIEEAEDFVQIAYAALWEKRETAMEPWKYLKGVARHEASHYLRRLKRERNATSLGPDQADLDQIAAITHAPDEEVVRVEFKQRVLRAFHEVINHMGPPERQATIRQLFELHLCENKSFPEIAEAWGMPPDTVKDWFYSVIRELPQFFEDEIAENGGWYDE